MPFLPPNNSIKALKAKAQGTLHALTKILKNFIRLSDQ